VEILPNLYSVLRVSPNRTRKTCQQRYGSLLHVSVSVNKVSGRLFCEWATLTLENLDFRRTTSDKRVNQHLYGRPSQNIALTSATNIGICYCFTQSPLIIPRLEPELMRKLSSQPVDQLHSDLTTGGNELNEFRILGLGRHSAIYALQGQHLFVCQTSEIRI
jgi:hypothetical protein